MHNFSLNAPVVTILTNPQKDWQKIANAGKSNIRTAFKKLDVDWKVFNSRDFLFTHASICSSVATEPNGYRIIEPCDELVNANGNAWTNSVLPHCFKTFVGGDIYQEHCQIPALSKGKILDSVLRPTTHKGENGKEAIIYVVDILCATNRKHENIVSRVESGELSTMSMGCVANQTQCSFCGKIMTDSDENCIHIEKHLGRYLVEGGKKYIVSELIGAMKNGIYVPDSCQFIEASWVEHPAYEGAVVNYFIENDELKQAREANRIAFNELFTENMFMKFRVADVNSMVAIRVAIDNLNKQRYIRTVKKVAGC